MDTYPHEGHLPVMPDDQPCTACEGRGGICGTPCDACEGTGSGYTQWLIANTPEREQFR